MPPGRRGFHLANLARPFRNVVDNELGVFNKALISLMNARDFKGLEDFAAGLIRTKARFLAGDWKIEKFYDAIFPGESFNVTPEQYLELLDSWAKAFPQSPTPLIAKAKFYDRLGWRARGGGFSETVTEFGWDEFHRQGQRAAEALKRAEKLKPRDPEYYVMLVKVIGAHQGSDADMEEASNTAGAPTMIKVEEIGHVFGWKLQP